MRRLNARNAGDAPLAVGSKPQAGDDVLVTQLRKLGEQRSLAHATGEITQDIAHSDSGAPDHRFVEANLRVEDDSVAIVAGGGHG